MITEAEVWLAVGFLGQGCFFMRFVWQWLTSEKVGKSVIPIPFWYFSIGGGLITLFYVIHLRALPLILGQAMGLVVYSRNLWLIAREKKEKESLARGGG